MVCEKCGGIKFKRDYARCECKHCGNVTLEQVDMSQIDTKEVMGE